MFLSVLKRRNPAFLESVASLHASGSLPPNCTVLDLDAISRNARAFVGEARRLGLTSFVMTKQLGRNRDALRVLADAGLSSAVAVDLECAIAARAGGLQIGHLGHLVQIPRHRVGEGVALTPRYWTVFSMDKAVEVGRASAAAGQVQDVLLRIHAEGDLFYRGHEGGFPAEDIVQVAEMVGRIPGLRVRGITTFPAMLFDRSSRTVQPTPNLRTLEAARTRLADAGMENIELNAPGTTSSATLQEVADHGATQVEPGHGITGTTPWHAFEDLVEEPAMLYLTEVSHAVGDDVFVFGGGLYADPVLPGATTRALVFRPGDGVETALETDVEMPAADVIDYYAILPGARRQTGTGDGVILGFRPQVFVTRSLTAGITGVGSGMPQVAGVWSANGSGPVTVEDALKSGGAS
jgi:predicted amino acid racemase